MKTNVIITALNQIEGYEIKNPGEFISFNKSNGFGVIRFNFFSFAEFFGLKHPYFNKRQNRLVEEAKEGVIRLAKEKGYNAIINCNVEVRLLCSHISGQAVIIDIDHVKKEEDYLLAIKTYEDKNYFSAVLMFENLGDYKDSFSFMEKCNIEAYDNDYYKGVELYNNAEFEKAKEYFVKCDDYKDSKKFLKECINFYNTEYYNKGILVYYDKDYEMAYANLRYCYDYSISKKYLIDILKKYFKNNGIKNYSNLTYEKIDEYVIMSKYELVYRIAFFYFIRENYKIAKEIFSKIKKYSDSKDFIKICDDK